MHISRFHVLIKRKMSWEQGVDSHAAGIRVHISLSNPALSNLPYVAPLLWRDQVEFSCSLEFPRNPSLGSPTGRFARWSLRNSLFWRIKNWNFQTNLRPVRSCRDRNWKVRYNDEIIDTETGSQEINFGSIHEYRFFLISSYPIFWIFVSLTM